MLSPSYSISPNDLWNAIATPSAPQLVDVRRRDAFEQSPQLLPGALWRDASKTQAWSAEFDRARPIVAACKAGHEMSQIAVAQLRADGFDARVLEGGYEGWAKAGLPFVAKPELDRLTPKRPEPMGHAAAAEDRPHRLPLADPPLPRPAGAYPVRRSGPRW